MPPYFRGLILIGKGERGCRGMNELRELIRRVHEELGVDVYEGAARKAEAMAKAIHHARSGRGKRPPCRWLMWV